MMRSLFILLMLSPLVATASDSARSRLESFSNGIQTISGRFEQSVTGANGKRGEVSSGSLALKAPRQFRWQTTVPYEQLIVADGDRVWVYDPDLEQVSVRSQGTEEMHSPLSILTDLSRLDEEFTVSESGERDGLVWLKLVSKAKEPEFSFAEIGFGQQGLEQMRFEDSLGNTTDIGFSAWKREARLPPDAFSFTPPEGVDVVGDPGSDAEVFPIEG